MRHTLLTGLAAGLFALSAHAADVPASPHQFSATAAVVSDYLFKGMTQTWGRPTVQASLDYAHSSGAYASLWTSGVSRKVYAGARSEIDLTVGYKQLINDDWSYGLGVLSVFYPGGNYHKVRYAALPSQRYDFTEAFASVSYQWLTLKYSHTLTDLAGFNQNTGYLGHSRGSRYIDLSADIPLADGYVLGLHAGRQHITTRLAAPTAGGSSNPDFTDYRVSLNKTLPDGWNASLALGWNDNTAFYNQTPSNLNMNDTRNVGKKRLVLSIGKTF